jgi:hypothetical protein
MQQADLQEEQQAQSQGILFSGVRGQLRSQAEAPYLQQIGAQELQTPLDLADQYNAAMGLISDYNTQNAGYLADAATRAAQAAEQNPTSQTPSTPAPTQTPTPPAPTQTQTSPSNQSQSDISLMPYYPPGHAPREPIAFATGGEITHPTEAGMGEQSTPGNPLSHEVIVPRAGLLPHENALLTNLARSAHLRLNGGPRGVGRVGGVNPGGPIHIPAPPVDGVPGIHAFGPPSPILGGWHITPPVEPTIPMMPRIGRVAV